MNYYVINMNTFSNSDKSKIIYLQESIDKSKYIVVTTETIVEYISTFNSPAGLEEWSKANPSGWVKENKHIEVI